MSFRTVQDSVTELTPAAAAAFRRKIYRYFTAHGRVLPWRFSEDPYHVLVSEIMLQQTQVDRVIPKFSAFIEAFPCIEDLACASRRAVLTAWQGLGYNRRALMLQQCAQEALFRHGGALPRTPDALIALPGIGKATAASIAAFAFDHPAVFIETNIRSVYIHEFFADAANIADSDILPLVEQTLDRKRPARWYNALMDYGVMLKKKHRNPSRKSAHHVKQSAFKGSDRQIRGAVVRALLEAGKALGTKALTQKTGAEPERLGGIIERLVAEGTIQKAGCKYLIR